MVLDFIQKYSLHYMAKSGICLINDNSLYSTQLIIKKGENEIVQLILLKIKICFL